jgi:mycothiol synthase
VTVAWRPLVADDLPALRELVLWVLGVDGGLPQAGDLTFLRARFGQGLVGVAEGKIVAAAGYTVDRGGTGVVAPTWRGRGLGSYLLDWLSDQAGDGLRVSTESLTDEADELFRSRGLRQSFAEDVMRFDLANTTPLAEPSGVTLTEWAPSVSARFHACYHTAFRERPGFPGWSREQWIEWISDDLVPQWTLLATRDGEDVGFVVGGAEGADAWIVQVGVVPTARGTGLGSGLTAEALRRMRADGYRSALLDVNVNNPGAGRVYDSLGFARIGRRARYER